MLTVHDATILAVARAICEREARIGTHSNEQYAGYVAAKFETAEKTLTNACIAAAVFRNDNCAKTAYQLTLNGRFPYPDIAADSDPDDPNAMLPGERPSEAAMRLSQPTRDT